MQIQGIQGYDRIWDIHVRIHIYVYIDIHIHICA